MTNVRRKRRKSSSLKTVHIGPLAIVCMYLPLTRNKEKRSQLRFLGNHIVKDASRLPGKHLRFYLDNKSQASRFKPTGRSLWNLYIPHESYALYYLLLLPFSCWVVSDSATPWTVACQVPLSMGFPRQEYCSGLPFPFSGDLPNPGFEPASPALADGFFTTDPPGKPFIIYPGWIHVGYEFAHEFMCKNITLGGSF